MLKNKLKKITREWSGKSGFSEESNSLSTLFNSITKKLKKMELNHLTKSKIETKNEQMNVTVNMYSSNVIFNKPTINQLNLKTGDRIVFTRDAQSGDWFFFQTADEDSFPLRRYAGSNMLAFSSKNLCKRIISAVDKEAYKISMAVDNEPLDYQGLTLYKMRVSEVEMDEFFSIEASPNQDPSHRFESSETGPAPKAF